MKETNHKRFKQLTTRYVPYSFRSRIEEAKSGVRVIQPKDVKDEQILWESVVTTALTGKKEPEYLKDGDILILSRGMKQQTFVFKSKDDEQKTICSNVYYHYRVANDEINPYYLAFVLNHNNKIKNQIEVGSASSSMTVKVYSRQSIEELDIPLPPKKEQDAIVALHNNITQQQQCYQKLMDSNQAMLASIASQLTK
ncbi:restriction endonuclease subunit S [Photobacterium chitinilyticum]|uniref:Restriction endonuclease subunit S n=1 Tax=Photobacterium chitinilyticum TaxID=2485123 RepID=A0A3S3UHZ7_9GAMM|nr:restriction endonuclease subunit S [Photobacterium chitinilyticum]RWX52894.1 restriction endonuclease subunit S [Photobacterium chitinilyticum]